METYYKTQASPTQTLKLSLVAAALLGVSGSLFADTYTVTTNAESGICVANVVQAGCSLEGAITLANNHPNVSNPIDPLTSLPQADHIVFAITGTPSYFIGGSPGYTIQMRTPLPIIADRVTIDGTTQETGQSQAGSWAMKHLVEINDASLILQNSESSGSTIRGLVVRSIEASNQSFEHLIEYNFLGTDPTGLIAKPYGGRRINMLSSYKHTIQYNLASAALVNIYMDRNPALGSDNVLNNKIGTDINGTPFGTPSNYLSQVGYIAYDGNGRTENNIIAGNRGNGIRCLACYGKTISNNTIFKNNNRGIGVDDTYSVAIVNNSIYANGNLGIDLENNGITLNDSPATLKNIIAYSDEFPEGPASQSVANAIDNDNGTKFLVDKIVNVGFIATLDAPGNGYAVQSMRLTSADDDSRRDPKTITLYGSNEATAPAWNGTWNYIGTVSNIAFTNRGETLDFAFDDPAPNVPFTNTTPYKHYKWNVVNVLDTSQNLMQIAEVRLLTAGPAPVDVLDSVGSAPRGDNDEYQNFPVLSYERSKQNPALVLVKGSLDSSFNKDYLIEIFSTNTAVSPANCNFNVPSVTPLREGQVADCVPFVGSARFFSGQGQTKIGQKIVKTDAAGHADFSLPWKSAEPGEIVTATATRLDPVTGAPVNTSEFSEAISFDNLYQVGSPQAYDSADGAAGGSN